MKRNTSNVWTLKETLVVAMTGVVFAFLYLAWVQLWLLVQALTGPLAMDAMFGFWFIAAVFAAYVVRKPGAAFVAEVITAVVQVLAGNPSGAILIVTGIVQGAGAEAVFAATRWRRYGLPTLLLSGVSSAVFSFVYTWIRFSYGNLAPGILVLMFVLRATSGALLGGLAGKGLADALHKTGVMSGLAIDRAKRGQA